MWSSYFDDFLSIEKEGPCRHTDMVISCMFSILGWEFPKQKLLEYSSVCKLFRFEFGFKMPGEGLTLVCNAAAGVKKKSD